MWTSFSQIVNDLGLPASPDDLEAIEKTLKQQLAALHPDATRGDFQSDGHKERYHRLSEALEFLRRQKSTNLPAVSAADIPAVVEATIQSLRRQEAVPPQTRPAVIDNVRQQARRTNRLPKITSGSLFAFGAGLFTLLGSAKEHPLLNSVREHPALLWILGSLWVSSGVGFLVIWLRERAIEREVQSRLSERGLQDAFRYACWLAKDNPDRRFSRHELLDNLTDHRPLSPLWLRKRGHKVSRSQVSRWLREFLPFTAHIDEHTAEEIASFYLGRWSERGAIKRSPFGDAAEWFEVDASVLARYT